MILTGQQIIKALQDKQIQIRDINPSKMPPRLFNEWCDRYILPTGLALPLGETFHVEDVRQGEPRRSRFGDEAIVAVWDGDPSPQFPSVLAKEVCYIPSMQWVLGQSFFHVMTGHKYAARVDVTREAAMWGVQVPSHWIPPMFSGEVTIPIFNCARRQMKLRPGHIVAQLTFERVRNYVKEGTALYQPNLLPERIRWESNV